MKTLVCFGDSNTHGTSPMADISGGNRFDAGIRWPQRLQKQTGTSWQVIEEGLPGRTTLHDDPIEGCFLNGLAYLPAVLRSHKPIDMILIMLGTNDLKARFSVTAFDIGLSLIKIAETISQSEAGPGGDAPEMLFICPPPIIETGCLAEKFIGGAAKSQQMQRCIPDLLSGAGYGTMMAAESIAVSEVDGIHFEPEAHAALAGAVAERLKLCGEK
ncbi:MAG: GDSL-type esterase/lipase family protein [Parvularculales bacterium]